MASWYYVVSKTRDKSGPHDEAHVRGQFITGEIAPTTLVWHDGLPDWIPAGEAFATLKSPDAAIAQVPLPEGLRAWMAFVGLFTVLGSLLPSLLLVGLPMLLTGFAVLGARSSLARTPYIHADLLPFFLKLKRLFACWGWMYVIGLLLFVLALLVYAALAIWVLSAAQGPLRLPLR